MKNENESKLLIEQLGKKYRYDKDIKLYFLGYYKFKMEYILTINYIEFKNVLSSFGINDKIKDLVKKYHIFEDNNDDEDEIKKIGLEIKNIKKEYKRIVKDSYENYLYYDSALKFIFYEYKKNYRKKGCEEIFDKISIEINSILNNLYIKYELKLINNKEKKKNLNLILSKIN